MLKNLYAVCICLVSMSIISAKEIINPTTGAGEQLYRWGLLNNVNFPRLHLGCGQQHFSGYVNIDYPPSEHTVQTNSGADVFGDITHIRFRQMSVQEIRLHHVFEHFDRPMALALLIAWHLWLIQGGTLYIEVPDFEASIAMITDKQYTYEQKQVILRHVFGSHEASWAIHCDGWYAEKFEHILSAMGFDEIVISYSSWKLTHNITVRAKKNKNFNREELTAVAYSILRESMVDSSTSEEKLCKQWLQKVISALDNLLI